MLKAQNWVVFIGRGGGGTSVRLGQSWRMETRWMARRKLRWAGVRWRYGAVASSSHWCEGHALARSSVASRREGVCGVWCGADA